MRRLLIALAALTLATAACSADGPAAEGSSAGGAPAELTVFAASSLTAAFTQIGHDFETAHTGTTVTFNFGPSDGLAGQIQSEGTADVFASASGTWMDAVQEDPGVEGRADFAMNRLVIITPPDNPAGIKAIEDLANPGVQLVLAAEGVPVGDYAREALDNAGISDAALANVVSNEEDDASVVAKVTSGDADAAIVYGSDISATAGDDVHAVSIPAAVNVVATYPIAVVSGSAHAALARDFVTYVTGSEGQATLRRFGFEPVA